MADRSARLLYIIGALFAIGFGVIGLLIKSWLFASIGIVCGLLIGLMGLWFDNTLKKPGGIHLLVRYIRPMLFVVLAIQVFIVMSKVFAQ